MRAAIYARFSCSKQREASIDDQLRVCRDYCAREGLEVIAEYSDYAISGRTDERPEFQRMIANAGEADFVVVYMMDRFSRDPYDAPIYKKRLLKKGVRVLSALERIDQTPDGVIMEKLLEGLAARESMVTAERTLRGMRGNAERCMYNGDRVFGYKVEDGRYAVDDSEAALVREAFQMRLRRDSLSSIARRLAALGVKTYQGNPCSPTMVANMLRNERYAGVYRWADVRVEGGMPAIIDRGTWEAVQKVKGRKNRKMEKYEDYALSGKAVCGNCGRSMVGVSGNAHGQKYTYYRCAERCGKATIRREVAEGLIVDALRDMLNGPEAHRIAQEVKKQWSGTDTAQKANAALNAAREAHSAKENLIRAIEDGMPFASVRDRLAELEDAEREARTEYELHKHDAEFDVDDFIDFLRFGATLDDRRLLDAFVSQVVFFDDRLAVLLNYDENETPRRLDLGVFDGLTSGSPLVRVCERMIILTIPRASARGCCSSS